MSRICLALYKIIAGIFFCKLARLKSKIGSRHCKGISRVFGYLKWTSNFILHYSAFLDVLEGYFKFKLIHQCECSEFDLWIDFYNGKVCYQLGIQEENLHLTFKMKTEFIALVKVGKEAEWLRNLLMKIDLWPQLVPPISIFWDCWLCLMPIIKFTMENLNTLC